MNHISNPKLQAIAARATTDLSAFIAESEQKLIESMAACAEEAQDQDAKAKFRIGMSITLDLDADTMETALTFGTRHKLSRTGEIPDPNQESLPLDDATKEAARDLAQTLNNAGGSISVVVGPDEAKMLRKAADKFKE